MVIYVCASVYILLVQLTHSLHNNTVFKFLLARILELWRSLQFSNDQCLTPLLLIKISPPPVQTQDIIIFPPCFHHRRQVSVWETYAYLLVVMLHGISRYHHHLSKHRWMKRNHNSSTLSISILQVWRLTSFVAGSPPTSTTRTWMILYPRLWTFSLRYHLSETKLLIIKKNSLPPRW